MNTTNNAKTNARTGTLLAVVALLAAVAITATAMIGYAIGGFLGLSISAVLLTGLAFGGVQAVALMFLDASDKRQTVAAARSRATRN